MCFNKKNISIFEELKQTRKELLKSVILAEEKLIKN